MSRTPERRVHHVFVTRDREYHVREGICVGVRARGDAGFVRGHVAVGCRVTGALALERGEVTEGGPTVGQSLILATAAGRLLTGRVARVERPEHDVVRRYPDRDDLR